MKILLIEDEKNLQKNIKDFLGNEKITCRTASTYNEAADKIYNEVYDCILLDITLPGGNGLSLLKGLKIENRNDGVIIISAKNSQDDKIDGLNLGADDYITKPFHLPELVARIKSVIRRKRFDGNKILCFHNLAVHVDDRQFFVDGKPVPLSKKETDLFLFFVSNKNRVLSKAAIADHLLNNADSYSNNYDIIYAHLKNLKRKLLEAGYPDYIKNIQGIGYKFEWYGND